MFNVAQPLFREDGTADVQAINVYCQRFLEVFSESEEWDRFEAEHETGGWTAQLLQFALVSLRVRVDKLSPEHQSDILFRLMPRRSVVTPQMAGDIVDEFRAFWRFTRRAFGFTNAGPCLQHLQGDVATRLQRALEDPNNFGPAKRRFLYCDDSEEDLDEPVDPEDSLMVYFHRDEIEECIRRQLSMTQYARQRMAKSRKRQRKRRRR